LPVQGNLPRQHEPDGFVLKKSRASPPDHRFLQINPRAKPVRDIRGRCLPAVTYFAPQLLRELVTVFVQHTSFVQHTQASLVIRENADPDVVRDLADYFERIAP
jgi:hypothetical protein